MRFKKLIKMKYTFIAIVLTLLISCSNDNNPEPIIDYTVENEQEILDYIAANELNAEKSDSGLYYVINELGTGSQPNLTDNVTVTYKGYLINGAIFDERDGGGVNFDLDQLIPGFSEGVTLLKEGGNGIFIIPSRLAYGNIGAGPIPPGAVLIIEIGLISVN